MTNKATLKTVWFWRTGEDSPELLTAWDEYSVDENREGFEAEWKKAYAVVAESDAGNGVRHINLNFDFDPVERSFWPTEVEATPETDGSKS